MKKESSTEKQKLRRRQFVERRFKGDEDGVEILLNGLRHGTQ